MAHKHKTIWLTEKEIGDLIWKDLYLHFSPYGNIKFFRECEIGNGRADFVSMTNGCVEIYELKITATIDSVIQIVKYQRDLNEYLRQVFYCGKIDHQKCPIIHLNLIARYFDTKIIELCLEHGISMWRVNVISNEKIKIELDEDYSFPVVPEYSQIKSYLIDYYGDSNG